MYIRTYTNNRREEEKKKEMQRKEEEKQQLLMKSEAEFKPQSFQKEREMQVFVHAYM